MYADCTEWVGTNQCRAVRYGGSSIEGGLRRILRAHQEVADPRARVARQMPDLELVPDDEDLRRVPHFLFRRAELQRQAP